LTSVVVIGQRISAPGGLGAHDSLAPARPAAARNRWPRLPSRPSALRGTRVAPSNPSLGGPGRARTGRLDERGTKRPPILPGPLNGKTGFLTRHHLDPDQGRDL
jgi:hypothetical protein